MQSVCKTVKKNMADSLVDGHDLDICTPGRVFLWCVPRSRSTVVTKCLSGIDGVSVWFTPFSLPFEVAREYREKTGQTLPSRFEGNEDLFKEAAKIWHISHGFEVNPERIGYANIQKEMMLDDSKFVFAKDQTYATVSDELRLHLPSGYTHSFLIREPSRAFSSYRKALSLQFNQGQEMDKDFSIILDDPRKDDILRLYQIQYEFWMYIRENIQPNPAIIDSHDLALNPLSTLKAYCARVGLPYSDSLLSWESSGLQNTGWKMAGDSLLTKQGHFYNAAGNSTGFIAPCEEGPIPRDQLTDDIIQCLDAATPYYQEMYKHRITV